MTTTDLKPGDLVQHPEHGFGFIVLLKKDLGDEPASEAVVRSTNPRRNYGHDWDLTGWERVETVRPGHVQVRVDDLDLEMIEGGDDSEANFDDCRAAIRAANAIAAKHAESTPPAGKKPTSATVTLFCPDCGGAENVTVVMLGKQSNGERWFDLREFHAHTCPPAQPDEPTLFGARIVVTDDLSGKAERWCRQHDEYWASENGALMTWAYLTQRGAVTLGWETLGWDE